MTKILDKAYINGGWRRTDGSAATFEVVNPATEQVVASIRMGGEDDVDRAIVAASGAFSDFASISLEERVALLGRIADAYDQRLDDIALAITTEMGAPLARLSKPAQAPLGLNHFRLAAKLAPEFEWEKARGTTLVRREPVGVCSLITPWNWPMNQLACKVAPALLAGCTLVVKPSEFAPLSAQIFAEIIDEAGVPPGAFNMVWGYGPDIGLRMSSHPLVDMVSLTGSTAAGASVARCAADSIKKVSLELGGKSANIILEDAPLSEAVKRGVMQLMSNSGQSCNAPSRMLVPAARIAEAEVVAADAVSRIVVGDPMDAQTTMGPIANQRQYQRVQTLIHNAIDEGARLIVGGCGRPDHLEKGYFAKPTIFSVSDNHYQIAREEVFGPVLTLIPYKDEDEAVAIANDSVYGLSGYVFGSTIARAASVAAKLRTGQVHLNGAVTDMLAPFGGYKQSGLGREWGKAGIEEFTEMKALLGALEK